MQILVGILLHDVVPIALTWALHKIDKFDLLSSVVTQVIREQIGAAGLFLSCCAAIAAAESFTRLPFASSRHSWWSGSNGFRLPHFLIVGTVFAIALLPFLADRFDVRLGLSPSGLAVLGYIAYLVLEACVGVLTGGSISWVLRRIGGHPGATSNETT